MPKSIFEHIFFSNIVLTIFFSLLVWFKRSYLLWILSIIWWYCKFIFHFCPYEEIENTMWIFVTLTFKNPFLSKQTLKKELTANCSLSNTVLTNYFGLAFRHYPLWILSIIWWYWKKAEKIEWIGLVKSCSLYIGLHVQKALVNPACNSHSIQDRISHSTQASLPTHTVSFSEIFELAPP